MSAARDLKGGGAVRDPFFLPPEDLARLQGKTVIVSMSGGKDSTAAALLLERNGIPFRAVMMDTGWEHPSTLAYARDVLAKRWDLTILSSEGMQALVRRKGLFPSRFQQFCTEQLKIEPFRRYLLELGADDVVSVLGIRRAESKRRADAARWNHDGHLGVDVYRPLVQHTVEDVIAMHQQAGIVPNPMYLDGAERVGCFPCIFARKKEIAQVSSLWPERIDEIDTLEQELTRSALNRLRDPTYAAEARERAILRVAYLVAQEPGCSWRDWKLHAGRIAKGRPGSLPAPAAALQAAQIASIEAGEHADQVEAEILRAAQRTFFYRSDGPGRGLSSIRSVVAWAQGHGQLSLDIVDDSGCMRWGMCDLPDEGPDAAVVEARHADESEPQRSRYLGER